MVFSARRSFRTLQPMNSFNSVLWGHFDPFYDLFVSSEEQQTAAAVLNVRLGGGHCFNLLFNGINKKIIFFQLQTWDSKD